MRSLPFRVTHLPCLHLMQVKLFRWNTTYVTDSVTEGRFNNTNCMEQYRLWGASNHSASQEISYLFWNPKIHFRIHNSEPLVPVLRQMNPVHNFPIYFSKNHSNIILLSTPRLSEWCLPFRFPTKILYKFLIFPMRSTWPAHHIPLDFITLIIIIIIIIIILGEAQKWWNFPLCSFLQPTATSSLLVPNILINAQSIFLR